MIHLMQLHYSRDTSNQTLAKWLTTYPNLQKTLYAFLTEWPHLKTSLACLSHYLSPHLRISECSAFDYCLTNAMIEISNCEPKMPATVQIFNDALTLTAASILVNFEIRDADNKGWTPINGNYLCDWLQSEPERIQQLKEGDLAINHHDSTGSTIFRLQRLIQIRTLLSVREDAEVTQWEPRESSC